MFGYINVNKDTLEKGHFGMWHTFLCGMCMSLKEEYGNRARLTAGWDINFYNILFHAVTETPAKIEMAKCASSPLKKRSIMQRDFITDKLATANLWMKNWISASFLLNTALMFRSCRPIGGNANIRIRRKVLWKHLMPNTHGFRITMYICTSVR